ncbi:hypothetical protein MKW92_014891 [Papaver armeniacum]|nr:hypothetical protein MKW92_014891 [Papaver armeniacum]
MLWSVITSLPQPIVDVPSFMCAEAFKKILPFCTGLAAGCMIWVDIAEVVPDSFKEPPAKAIATKKDLQLQPKRKKSPVMIALMRVIPRKYLIKFFGSIKH